MSRCWGCCQENCDTGYCSCWCHGKNKQTSKHYYEAHVTVEPVEGERLSFMKLIAEDYSFRVAELLLRNGTKHRDDTFCTSRHVDWDHIRIRTEGLVRDLRENGFKVFRYKIEDTLVDSNIRDELNLLG